MIVFLNKIVPIKSIKLETDLTKEEAIQSLKNKTRSEEIKFSKEMYNLDGLKKHFFVGKVNSDSFDLKRVLNNRYSLLPTVKGSITKAEKRTKIEFVIKPNFYSILVILILCLSFCIGALILLFKYLTQGFDSFDGIIELTVLAFTIGLLLSLFNSENDEIKTEMTSMFNT